MRHEVGWYLSPLTHGVTGGGEFFPFSPATVATLCPFLLPPIRRHRSVIRNCVSLSSPYPIWLDGLRTIVRVPAYFFSFLSVPFYLDLTVSISAPSTTIIVRPAVSFPLLPDSEALSLLSFSFLFFSFSFLARRDNSR